MDVVGPLLEWHRRHGRNFPWRDNPTPYRVLVAEVLLQRTPAERVSRYYDKLVSTYPDVSSLAKAREREVSRPLRRLGLRKRVKWLVEAARVVQSRYGGEIPSSYEELTKLPGVGDYTASAVLVFGFGRPVPLVDVNVARVVSRVFGLEGWAYAAVREVLTDIVPADGAAAFYGALLDLAALVCVKRPRCDACPLADLCDYARTHATKY